MCDILDTDGLGRAQRTPRKDSALSHLLASRLVLGLCALPHLRELQSRELWHGFHGN